ncbi:oxidoreductase [Actinomadura meridiana]|uniref:Oxidoreductase n=1 Tax=Actinomadura meridiana TaxID=559626 RepID=A0ABP8CEI3_9ACTN
MNIEDLTPTERRLWEAFPKGESVDLSSGDASYDDIDQADRWGHDRVVRAEVLVALLAGAVEPEPGQVAAVRLGGARVTGSLNLGHADVSVPLALTSCSFDEAPHLYWASMNSVHLMRCQLPGLIASGTRVDGHLWLEGSRINGGLWLDGANITGILNMSGVQLTNPGGDALLADRLTVEANVYCDQGFSSTGEVRLPGATVGGQLIFRGAKLHNPSGAALYASRLNVAANVFCDGGFTAEGEVRLRGATVGGYLSFVGARLSAPQRTALNADDLTVETDIYCSDGFTAVGAVSFSGARVTGQLSFRDARLRHDQGTALSLQRVQAEELLLRTAEPIHGTADLSYARISLLRDDAASWPERLQLDGLQYEALDPPLAARERLAWLRRDTDGYAPQPYERLAQAYRALGLDADGRSVLLAKARDRRATQGLSRKLVGWMQDGLVGYGYRPFRAASWLIGLLAFGTVVFSIHKPEVLDGGQQPHFNAFFFTLDLLLPIGTLGQETVFAPEGVYQWIANFIVAGGLVLGLTVAAGVTRALSRE